MRYRFAREGITTILDVHLVEGSLQWDDDKLIPVLWENDFSTQGILGQAHDLRREDGGWLSAEIDWTNEDKSPAVVELIDHGDLFLTIYATNVTEQDRRASGGHRHVQQAELRSIYTTMNDTWVDKELGGS